MGRANYSDDGEYLELWRGAVDRAIYGKRGQEFLRDMLVALDSLPEKVLIAEDIVNEHGDLCALGAVARHRRINAVELDPEDHETLSVTFKISRAMVQEIEYVNDEYWPEATPQQRFAIVREWVTKKIRSASAATPAET